MVDLPLTEPYDRTLLMKKSPYADIIQHVIKRTPEQHVLLICDAQSSLARELTHGYKAAATDAEVIDFDTTTPDVILRRIEKLHPGDVVILVQSSSFRLNAFRLRVELFKLGLAVIEHAHLNRIPPEEQSIYIDALAYDPAYYQATGHALKQHIDTAKRIVVACEGTELIYIGPFEDAKLNIGDYSHMKNRGGQFPIGEVFTEPKFLDQVNGTVKIFAFGDMDFHVTVPEQPITLTIAKGIVTHIADAPPAFQAVADAIQADEQLMIRELGFGMNRAFTKTRRVTDIGSYERLCGIHLSLGQKHALYNKEGISKRASRYHVDVFADVTQVSIDETVVYQNGSYVI